MYFVLQKLPFLSCKSPYFPFVYSLSKEYMTEWRKLFGQWSGQMGSAQIIINIQKYSIIQCDYQERFVTNLAFLLVYMEIRFFPGTLQRCLLL